MKTPLKLSELEEGEIYECLLSGKKVLITELNSTVSILGQTYETTRGRYYSENRGYEYFEVQDNQLIHYNYAFI